MVNNLTTKRSKEIAEFLDEEEVCKSLDAFAVCFNYTLTSNYVACLVDLFSKYASSKYDFQEAYEKMMIRPKNKNYGMPSPSDWLECAGLLEKAERDIEAKYNRLRNEGTLC